MLNPTRTPAEVSDLEDETVSNPDGSVRSIQSATVELPARDLESIWHPRYLERLARTYWRFLSRITLGVIRIKYRPDGRDIVLLFKPLKLLSFHAPEYEMDADTGVVTWRIASGLLVARQGEGYLRISVRRLTKPTGEPDAHAALHVDVEVNNFYPAIAAKISDHLYRWTQSRIHVIVTMGFLRSLARGDLETSVIGRFEGTD